MKYIAVLISSLFTFSVWASSISNTTVTRLMIDRQYMNYVYVQVERTPTRDSAHCHANLTWDYVLNVSDMHGQIMHSKILTAYAAGKAITLAGTDLCPIGQSEALRRIEIH